ncbi:acid protease [Xylariaceae sp. FL0016]|nr:acid protease [Xylariaceae sp. FL0016]
MFFMLMLALASFCLASPLKPRVPLIDHGDVVHSLSLPGIQFRKAVPFSKAAVKKQVQNHMNIRRVPHHRGVSRHRSATSRIGQVQRDNGGQGYENVTAVNAYAAEYAVEVNFNGVIMDVILDSGSADTWLRSHDFACRDSLNNTLSGNACSFGPAFFGNFSGKPIPDQHFSIGYGDGEMVQGRLGYMDVEFANVTVSGQEVALATQGNWNGNNITSGILGLAYPSLTNAFWGNDLDDHDQYNQVPYSPIFSRMINDGLIEPYWSVALDRNSSMGLVGVGGLPPVDVDSSHVATAQILIANLADKDVTADQLSFYTIVPTGFRWDQTENTSQYPFIIDTGTTLTYLPKEIADAVNNAFQPPATYLWEYGSYFTDCNAIPPRFSVLIDGSDFLINPADMLNKHAKDPETGLCQTGVSSGGTGPYVLGITFLTNVMVMFNVGQGTVEFYSREFY